jgi:hypothetical protein
MSDTPARSEVTLPPHPRRYLVARRGLLEVYESREAFVTAAPRLRGFDLGVDTPALADSGWWEDNGQMLFHEPKVAHA